MLKDGDGYEYPLSIDHSLYYLYMILKGIEFLLWNSETPQILSQTPWNHDSQMVHRHLEAISLLRIVRATYPYARAHKWAATRRERSWW